MKAEIDKEGIIWIKAETIAEYILFKEVIMVDGKYQTEGIGYDSSIVPSKNPDPETPHDK